MDEQTWCRSNDLQALLNYLCWIRGATKTKLGRRRLKLFEVACVRRCWHLLDESWHAIVEGAERFADGKEDRASMEKLAKRANRMLTRKKTDTGAMFAAKAAAAGCTDPRASMWLTMGVANGCADAFSGALADAHGTEQELTQPQIVRVQQDHRAEVVYQTDLVREIFGNPFWPLTIRKWPADIVGLAQSCYEDPGNYPLLADALTDLGEDGAAAHCRLPGHVKGCHVVDWVLGRV